MRRVTEVHWVLAGTGCACTVVRCTSAAATTATGSLTLHCPSPSPNDSAPLLASALVLSYSGPTPRPRQPPRLASPAAAGAAGQARADPAATGAGRSEPPCALHLHFSPLPVGLNHILQRRHATPLGLHRCGSVDRVFQQGLDSGFFIFIFNLDGRLGVGIGWGHSGGCAPRTSTTGCNPLEPLGPPGGITPRNGRGHGPLDPLGMPLFPGDPLPCDPQGLHRVQSARPIVAEPGLGRGVESGEERRRAAWAGGRDRGEMGRERYWAELTECSGEHMSMDKGVLLWLCSLPWGGMRCIV